MQVVDVPVLGFVKTWRDAARSLLGSGVAPDSVSWRFAGSQPGLFETGSAAAPVEPDRDGQRPVRVPARFFELAEAVLCHSDPERFGLLYRMLWRLQTSKNVLGDFSDPGVNRLEVMAKSVRRDCHKMTAFVRFREVDGVENGRRRFHAWFEPDHFIVERTAPFFAKRFGDMDWTIETPTVSARFRDGKTQFGPGTTRPERLDEQADALWNTYYSNTFNPARLKIKAMQAEMPKKYWRNLPEARLIPGMIAEADRRVEDMRAREASVPPPRAGRIKQRLASGPVCSSPPIRSAVDPSMNLRVLRAAAGTCTRCALSCAATQTVFGEGPRDADIVFVGEQPGDREDLAGRPFVGPAGHLFDRTLAEAGLDRSKLYVTNAVKHFKFQPRGKRRIHQRPNAGEVRACKWWLDREIRLIEPRLIVAMGATAALALTGNGREMGKRRGTFEISERGTAVFLTFHPSALLRIPDPDKASQAIALFRGDMRTIRSWNILKCRVSPFLGTEPERL